MQHLDNFWALRWTLANMQRRATEMAMLVAEWQLGSEDTPASVWETVQYFALRSSRRQGESEG
jgi:hypothetical protein